MLTLAALPRTVEALRRLAHSRDPEAWASLLEDHGTEILRVTQRILHDPDLAEDACQETLLQLRDLAGQFRPGGEDPEKAARIWIQRIACHTALHMLRKLRSARRREEAHARAGDLTPMAASHAQADRERDAARNAAVRGELARMPDAEQLPIALHFYCGLEYSELASVLNCPVGTAKARVSRGVEKLRRRLASLGLLIPTGELAAYLRDPAINSPEGEMPGATQQMEGWCSLLESTRKPALPMYAPPKGGISTMVKFGSGLAAVFLASVLLFTGMRSQGAEVPEALKPASPSPKPGPRLPPPGPSTAVVKMAQPAPGELKMLAENNNAFALDLFAKLKAQEKSNLFFSPYSISTALAMTYAGARGNTEAEMAKALRFTLGQDRLHLAMGALIGDLNAETKNGKPRGFALSVANSLWGQKGYAFKPDFLALNKECYGAGLQAVDFLKATEEARLAINAWVEQKTKEKIKELIAQGMLTPDNRLVLVNAIYFKGNWEFAFKKEQTKNELFHLTGGKSTEASLMNQTGSFRYLEEENRFQLLELPYVNRELSMLVFLPATVEGLPGLENVLTAENINKWTAALQPAQVRVGLPKFKMTWGTEDLKPQLHALGMKDAFQRRAADFSGIDGGRELYIGMVLHKAFVDVNEEGTEAAAATAVVTRSGAASQPSPKPKVFRADRPFLFAIRDNSSGSILFLGRVMDPR